MNRTILKDKVALVTGASSGIGEAVAKNLDEAGMLVVVTARRRDRLEMLASDLTEATFLAGDITDPELPEQLIELALEGFGRLDVVVNNAGILETGTIEEIDIDRMCRMVRVNVEATFRMAYTALRHFARLRKGHLVNVSSVLDRKIRPSAAAYAGTKHALRALTETLRLEVAGSGIFVSSVEPGMVITELHDHFSEHPTQAMGIRRPLQPTDVAQAVRVILEQPSGVHYSNLTVLPEDSSL